MKIDHFIPIQTSDDISIPNNNIFVCQILHHLLHAVDTTELKFKVTEFQSQYHVMDENTKNKFLPVFIHVQETLTAITKQPVLAQNQYLMILIEHLSLIPENVMAISMYIRSTINPTYSLFHNIMSNDMIFSLNEYIIDYFKTNNHQFYLNLKQYIFSNIMQNDINNLHKFIQYKYISIDEPLDHESSTLLKIAWLREKYEVFHYLIQNGANIYQIDNDNNSIYHLIAKQPYTYQKEIEIAILSIPIHLDKLEQRNYSQETPLFFLQSTTTITILHHLLYTHFNHIINHNNTYDLKLLLQSIHDKYLLQDIFTHLIQNNTLIQLHHIKNLDDTLNYCIDEKRNFILLFILEKLVNKENVHLINIEELMYFSIIHNNIIMILYILKNKERLSFNEENIHYIIDIAYQHAEPYTVRTLLEYGIEATVIQKKLLFLEFIFDNNLEDKIDVQQYIHQIDWDKASTKMMQKTLDYTILHSKYKTLLFLLEQPAYGQIIKLKTQFFLLRLSLKNRQLYLFEYIIQKIPYIKLQDSPETLIDILQHDNPIYYIILLKLYPQIMNNSIYQDSFIEFILKQDNYSSIIQFTILLNYIKHYHLLFSYEKYLTLLCHLNEETPSLVIREKTHLLYHYLRKKSNKKHDEAEMIELNQQLDQLSQYINPLDNQKIEQLFAYYKIKLPLPNMTAQ